MKELMIVIIVLGFIGVLFCLFMAFVRNNLVYNVRKKAINIIYNNRVVGDGSLDWNIHDRVSYEKMMWDFSKWKFSQFYPELVEKKKGA